MSGIGGRQGGRGIISSGRGLGVRRNFNSSNNLNKRQELNFYPHGTGTDRHTATFTKMMENPILKIQSEFLNGSDIAIFFPRKGLILFKQGNT